MLAAGLCSARRRGRTLGLPADWTLRSRDTDGLTRCPFRLGAQLRPSGATALQFHATEAPRSARAALTLSPEAVA